MSLIWNAVGNSLALETALREVSGALKEEQHKNKHLLHLLESIFPLKRYKDLRPDVVEYCGSNDEGIFLHFVQQGYKEIDVKKLFHQSEQAKYSDHSKIVNDRRLVSYTSQMNQLVARLVCNLIASTKATGRNLLHHRDLDKSLLKNYSLFSAGRYGPILHFGDQDIISRSIYLYGEWAQNEVDFLGSFIGTGSVILDVGAYIGTHTRAFAEIVGDSGSVLSFEPNYKAFEKLRVNASISNVDNIKIFEYAIGAKNEMKTLKVGGLSNLGSTRVDSARNKGANIIQVECKKLDSVINTIKRVDLIKLDIEGAELDALKGAGNIISKFQPVLYCEINSLMCARSIYNWANANGYKAWGCIHDAYNKLNYNAENNDVFEGGKESGLCLISKKKGEFSVPKINGTKTREIKTIEDIAIVLASKPQYALQSW